MTFGRDFRAGLLGTDYVKDFKHGSKVFVSDTHALAPRLKFLYHTYFTINTAVPALRNLYPRSDQSRIGLMVKSIQLPTFDVQTDTLRQYNRSRVVQTGVRYNPITITLHDDGSDIIRTLWRQYYSYYYSDTHAPTSDAGQRNIYSESLDSHSWGVNSNTYGSSGITHGVKPPFFSEITIYGFNQKNNVGYRVVNPTIKTWQHDTYDYSQGNGVMEHTVTVEYEYVQYLDRTAAVPGFAEPSAYDSSASPLGQAGSTTSVFGPGGVLDSAGQVLGQLAGGNPVGALISGVRMINTAKDMNRSAAMKEESQAKLTEIIREIRTSNKAYYHPK